MEDNKPHINARSLYAKSIGKHLKTKEAYKNEANDKSYADVEKKYGKEMREKLKSFHEANERGDYDNEKHGGSINLKDCEIRTAEGKNSKLKNCW